MEASGTSVEQQRRRLHGRRGLKSSACILLCPWLRSPPSRAAWIEIVPRSARLCRRQRRRLHGRRGLKSTLWQWSIVRDSRRLHGRRGLKLKLITVAYTKRETSPPSRAAWIEMGRAGHEPKLGNPSPPSRAAWIEICRPDLRG